MKNWFEKNSSIIRLWTMMVTILLPFIMYAAANADHDGLVEATLLGFGLNMLVIMIL